jgi:hypothetical protein
LWGLDYDMTAGDARGKGLDLFGALADVSFDGIGVWHLTEGDLNGKAHLQVADRSRLPTE